jgi:uncharacterized membrane protein
MTDLPSPESTPPLQATDVTSDVVAGSARGDADHIIGMSFDKPTRADEVLLALIHLQQEGEITLTDAVVVSKTDNGKVHIRQTVDPTVGESALKGSIWGMLIGLLFPPAAFVAAAAAGAGGAALLAKLVDLGLDDKWVKDVGTRLDPGTSALLLLVSADVRPAVLAELARFEGKVLYCTFPEAVRAELERALSGRG